MNIFDNIKIEQRLAELKDKPRFLPDKYEPRYSVTQYFDTIGGDMGKEVTLYFVLRNGEISFYDSKELVIDLSLK